VEHDLEKLGDDLDDETMDNARPFLMGKVAAVVEEKKSAREIVDEFVTDAVKSLQSASLTSFRNRSCEVVDSFSCNLSKSTVHCTLRCEQLVG